MPYVSRETPRASVATFHAQKDDRIHVTRETFCTSLVSLYNGYMLSLEQDQRLIKKTDMMLELMSNGMSQSEAMIETEYRIALAQSTKAVLATDAWGLVMERYLPDDVLGARHKALLDKNDSNGSPDTMAVSKALDMAYKLKGKYVEKIDVTSGGKALPASIVFNFNKKKDEVVEVQAIEEGEGVVVHG